MSDSRTSQPQEGSAMLSIFGSHVSLAELNGDVSRVNSRVPSRSATPQPRGATPPPATKRARAKSMSVARGRTLYKKKLSTQQQLARAAALFASGVLFHLTGTHFVKHGVFGPFIAAHAADLLLTSLFFTGFAAVAIGILFVTVDRHLGASTCWQWIPYVRGAGAIFGLYYATIKEVVPWSLWSVSNPVLWYLVDATAQGFTMAAALAVVSGTVSALMGTGSKDALILGSTVFSAVVFWGNLGRRLWA